MNVHISMSGVEGLLRYFQRAARKTEKNAATAMHRIGATVKDRAQEYAPISPTDTDKKRASKATKKQWAAARNRRSKDATTRTKPGGLTHSIRFESDARAASVFVPSNSTAGKYAVRIHDEKGKTWHKRGLGTQRKGDKADAKFIERAIFDSEDEIEIILKDQMGRTLPR